MDTCYLDFTDCERHPITNTLKEDEEARLAGHLFNVEMTHAQAIELAAKILDALEVSNDDPEFAELSRVCNTSRKRAPVEPLPDVLVDEEKPRRFILGIGTDPDDLPTRIPPNGGVTMVSAHATMNFEVEVGHPKNAEKDTFYPQAFQPKRFTVSSNNAEHFTVDALFVDGRAVLPEPMPAKRFVLPDYVDNGDEQFKSPARFDGSFVKKLSVRVTNHSDKSLPFFGAFRGHVTHFEKFKG
jgi:hypothetical protein